MSFGICTRWAAKMAENVSTVKPQNSLIRPPSMTFYSWKDCKMAWWLLPVSRAHNFTTFSKYFPSCRLLLLIWPPWVQAGERESWFRREQEGAVSRLQGSSILLVLCFCSWMYFRRNRVMWRDKTQGDAVQKCLNASAVIHSVHFRMNKSQTMTNDYGVS